MEPRRGPRFAPVSSVEIRDQANAFILGASLDLRRQLTAAIDDIVEEPSKGHPARYPQRGKDPELIGLIIDLSVPAHRIAYHAVGETIVAELIETLVLGSDKGKAV